MFATELAVDLARVPGIGAWPSADIQLLADLLVTVIVATIEELLEAPNDQAVDAADDGFDGFAQAAVPAGSGVALVPTYWSRIANRPNQNTGYCSVEFLPGNTTRASPATRHCVRCSNPRGVRRTMQMRVTYPVNQTEIWESPDKLGGGGGM